MYEHEDEDEDDHTHTRCQICDSAEEECSMLLCDGEKLNGYQSCSFLTLYMANHQSSAHMSLISLATAGCDLGFHAACMDMHTMPREDEDWFCRCCTGTAELVSARPSSGDSVDTCYEHFFYTITFRFVSMYTTDAV